MVDEPAVPEVVDTSNAILVSLNPCKTACSTSSLSLSRCHVMFILYIYTDNTSTYTCTHTHTHTHALACIYSYTYMHACTHMWRCICTCIYTYIHKCQQKGTYIYTFICTWGKSVIKKERTANEWTRGSQLCLKPFHKRSLDLQSPIHSDFRTRKSRGRNN